MQNSHRFLFTELPLGKEPSGVKLSLYFTFKSASFVSVLAKPSKKEGKNTTVGIQIYQYNPPFTSASINYVPLKTRDTVFI